MQVFTLGVYTSGGVVVHGRGVHWGEEWSEEEDGQGGGVGPLKATHRRLVGVFVALKSNWYNQITVTRVAS